MKRFIYIFSILIASFALQGCERDEILINEGLVPDGFMPLNIAFSAPDMIDVETKAVDPDGKGINSITLFCFDNFGMFIHYVDNVQIVPAEVEVYNIAWFRFAESVLLRLVRCSLGHHPFATAF